MSKLGNFKKINKINFLLVFIFFISKFYAQDISESGSKNTGKIFNQLVIPENINNLDFNFVNKDLAEIINNIASKLDINIILPQGANEIKQKITFRPKSKSLSSKEWIELIDTFLDLAGYALVQKSEKLYSVIKLNTGADKYKIQDSLPLYVNVDPQDLPFSDGPVRAIFYLENIPVTTGPVQKILGDMLTSEKSVSLDSKTNGIILTDRANLIASAMKILSELDSMGTKNEMVVVQLYNSDAKQLVDLIKKQIIGTLDGPQNFLFNEPKTESAVIFPKSLRLAAEERTNSIIIMGKHTAVERMQEFIQDVLDAPLEAGTSILHYYDLQYLKASELEKILQNIFVSPVSAQGAGISVKETFRGVKIFAEIPVKQETENKVAGSTGGLTRGGNRILVAARREDWLRIKALIQDLDRPQKQIIIEVLIVDLALTNNRALGTQLRSVFNTRFGETGQFQLANLAGPAVARPPENPPGLETDLMGNFYTNPVPPPSTIDIAALLSGRAPGSLIISLDNIEANNNPNAPRGAWAVMQILSQYASINVISHPYVVTINNHTALIEEKDIRRGAGDATLVASGGAINIAQVDIPAAVRVKVIPRASSEDRVNLSLKISIEQFTSLDLTNLTTLKREIDTQANISTGEVLVLGGLFRNRAQEAQFSTPILDRIPILRWLFGSRSVSTEDDNLVVFVVPTVVEPRVRDGLDKYTNNKVSNIAEDLNAGTSCADFRDPITRVFFKPKIYERRDFEGYLEDSNKHELTRAERRKKNSNIKPIDINLSEKDELLDRLKTVASKEENPFLGIKNRQS